MLLNEVEKSKVKKIISYKIYKVFFTDTMEMVMYYKSFFIDTIEIPMCIIKIFC